MVENDGRVAKADPEKTVFIVVEAKRTARLADASSEAELIGQLKSQLIRRYTPPQLILLAICFTLTFHVLLTVSATASHIGALTDGKSWRFYYIVEDKFYLRSVEADTQEQISLVLGTYGDWLSSLTLGILTLFCAGKFPTSEKTAATWVQGPLSPAN